MRKNKILAVVLIGLLMAGGLVLAGCDEDQSCPTDYKCRVGSDSFYVSSTCGKSKCATSRKGATNVSCSGC
jgi:hypothetical protein